MINHDETLSILSKCIDVRDPVCMLESVRLIAGLSLIPPNGFVLQMGAMSASVQSSSLFLCCCCNHWIEFKHRWFIDRLINCVKFNLYAWNGSVYQIACNVSIFMFLTWSKRTLFVKTSKWLPDHRSW